MTWKKKGNRIRASDKSLVYHFCIGWLLLLFVAVFLLLTLRQLLVIDWKDFNLLHAGITWTAYNSITVLIATGVCALVAFLYYRFCYDSFKKLLHRQKLARMILENKWYEADTVQNDVFSLICKADQGKNRLVSKDLLSNGKGIAPYPL